MQDYNRLVAALVARNAAVKGDIKTVVNYLRTERQTNAPPQELFILMFPNAHFKQLPDFYTRPYEYLMEDPNLEEEARHLEKLVSDIGSTSREYWIHWMKTCYAVSKLVEAHKRPRDVVRDVQLVQQILAGEALTVDFRRDVVDLLKQKPALWTAMRKVLPSAIECSICSAVDVSSMCSACGSYICSHACMTDHAGQAH